MRNPLARLRKHLFRLRQRPVIASRHGRLFLLDGRNFIDNRLLAKYRYEDAQLTAARDAVIARKLELLIDIGANIGLYAVVIGGMKEIVEGIAFEPVARNAAQLHANLFLNNLASKITVHQLAIGAEPGLAEIHIDPRSTGLSRLNPKTASRDKRKFSEVETVSLVRFDDIISTSGRRAFVKIDVEGAGLATLSSMGIFLRNNRSVIQIELSAEERPLAASVLAGLGYHQTGAIEGDCIFETVFGE